MAKKVWIILGTWGIQYSKILTPVNSYVNANADQLAGFFMSETLAIYDLI